MYYDGVLSKPPLDELFHHGILGMKWGKKNGPPYPLDASDHSSSEKKAGYKRSLGGGRNESLYGNKKAKKKKTPSKWDQLSDKEKQAQLKKDLEKENEYFKKRTSELDKKYSSGSNSKISKEALKVMRDNLANDIKNNHNKNSNSQKYRNEQVKSLQNIDKKWNEMSEKEKQAQLKKDLAEEDRYFNNRSSELAKKYPPGSNPYYKKKR